MLQSAEIIEKDQSTEQKIKEAARAVFHSKGFAATRTRDIAEAAGINLALLNYYFRSKEKLFDLIMIETLKEFMFSLVSGVFNNEETSLDEKVHLIVDRYIDMLIIQPEMPLFILSELKRNQDVFLERFNPRNMIVDSFFVKQYQTAIENGEIMNVQFPHFLMNLMGLIVFPFVGSPMLKHIVGFSNEEFKQAMLERKRLIPIWVKAMLQHE